jgi:hypothetical protein
LRSGRTGISIEFPRTITTATLQRLANCICVFGFIRHLRTTVSSLPAAAALYSPRVKCADALIAFLWERSLPGRVDRLISELRALTSMACIRLLSGAIEVSAALVMLRLASLRSAVRINALLGLIGPMILLSASFAGIAGMAGRVPTFKLLMIVTGVALILLGTR